MIVQIIINGSHLEPIERERERERERRERERETEGEREREGGRGGGQTSKVESQALARSGKFGSSDDAGSTFNSSGYLLSPPAGRRDMGGPC